jgi:protein-S-isoprenylcysteine O-methyltransferase Ste14
VKTFIMQYALFVVIGALLVLALTGNLFSSSPVVLAVQLLAVALSIWARASFPTGSFRIDATPSAQTVIRRGPYRWIRHPMYAAALTLIWAAVLSHVSFWVVALGIVVAVVVTLRILFEERFLRERYPDYVVYAQGTKAVIPYVL